MPRLYVVTIMHSDSNTEYATKYLIGDEYTEDNVRKTIQEVAQNNAEEHPELHPELYFANVSFSVIL